MTALKTREEFEDLMIERGVADEDADGGFRNVDFGYLGQLDARRNPVDNRPQVAVVVASGEISGGDPPAGRIGGESTSALLRRARRRRCQGGRAARGFAGRRSVRFRADPP